MTDKDLPIEVGKKLLRAIEKDIDKPHSTGQIEQLSHAYATVARAIAETLQ